MQRQLESKKPIHGVFNIESPQAMIGEFNDFHFNLDLESDAGLDLIEDLARYVFFDDVFVPAVKREKVVCMFHTLHERGLEIAKFDLIDIFSRLIQSKGINKTEAEEEAVQMFQILFDVMHVSNYQNEDGKNEVAYGIRELENFFERFKVSSEKENIYKTVYLFYFLTYRLHGKDPKYIKARTKWVSQVTPGFFGLRLPNIPLNLGKLFDPMDVKGSSSIYEQKQNFLEEVKEFLMDYLQSNPKILLDTNTFFSTKPGQYISDGKTFTHSSSKLAYDILIDKGDDSDCKKRMVDNFVESFRFDKCSEFSESALANKILRDFILKYVIVDSRLV